MLWPVWTTHPLGSGAVRCGYGRLRRSGVISGGRTSSAGRAASTESPRQSSAGGSDDLSERSARSRQFLSIIRAQQAAGSKVHRANIGGRLRLAVSRASFISFSFYQIVFFHADLFRFARSVLKVMVGPRVFSADNNLFHLINDG